MAIINVKDYELLEMAKRNCENAETEARNIVSKIQNVSSNLDSRVQSRMSGGLQGLSSSFEKNATKLAEFGSNMENTIFHLHSLEDEIQGNMSFTDKLFSEKSAEFQFLPFFSTLENQEEFTTMILKLFSNKLTSEEMEKITSDKDLAERDKNLKNYKELYNWLNTNQGNICFEFYKKERVSESQIKLNEKFLPVLSEILQTIIDKDSEMSNARYPKDLAAVYGNIAVVNQLAHFGYGAAGRSNVVFGNGFDGLLENGYTDCIGFVKWSYYQALKDVYVDNPEKLELIQKNMASMDIGGNGLINPKFNGNEEGSYLVNGKKKEEAELIANMLEPGDVIVTNIKQEHVRLVTSVDKENKTFTTAESTKSKGFCEDTWTVEGSLMSWAKNGNTVTIVKGDKITSYLTGDEVSEIACKTYNNNESLVDTQFTE